MPNRDFESFEASELFCPKCRRSQPVRSRLLLVLPTGNQFDYECVQCGTAVGSRSDGDHSQFSTIRAAAARAERKPGGGSPPR